MAEVLAHTDNREDTEADDEGNVLPVENRDCVEEWDADIELMDDVDRPFDIEFILDWLTKAVTERVWEINEVSVTSAVKDGDCDTDRSDEGEELSRKEIDGNEDCVSDILIRDDADEEANADGETLTCAKRVDVIVLHAVIESLWTAVIEFDTLGECDNAGEVEEVTLSIEVLDDEGSEVVEKVIRAEFDTEEVVDGVALERGEDEGLFDRCGDIDVDELDVTLIELKEEALSVASADVEKVIRAEFDTKEVVDGVVLDRG